MVETGPEPVEGVGTPKVGSGSPRSPRPTIAVDPDSAGLGTNLAVPPRSSLLPPFRPLAWPRSSRKSEVSARAGCAGPIPGSPIPSTLLPPASLSLAYQDRQQVKRLDPNSDTHTCMVPCKATPSTHRTQFAATDLPARERTRRIQAGPGGPTSSSVSTPVTGALKARGPHVAPSAPPTLTAPGASGARFSSLADVHTNVHTQVHAG